MAILQKYIDSVEFVKYHVTIQHYEDEKAPMSVLIQDLLMFYKYGGKQLYYNNTFDGQGEIDINKEDKLPDLEAGELDDEDCESCKI